MVLTMVPCSDAAKGLGEKVCLADNVHLEQGQDQHADLCTTFCVCNCCGMSMTIAQIKELLPEKITLSNKPLIAALSKMMRFSLSFLAIKIPF